MDERNLELLENCSDNMSNSRTTETAGLSSRTDDGDDDKWTGPVYLELTESRGGTDQGTDLDNSTPSKRTPIKWAKFNIFLACLCFVALCESCIVRGYSGAILTTLQKQFGFTTRQSGLICTSYEFGHIPFVIIVSLLSKRYNRSKLIGAGGLLMGLGCVVYLVPMFITFSNPSLLHNVATDTSDPDSDGYRAPSNSGPMLCSATNVNSSSTCSTRSAGASTWMVAILCIAQCILGIGASPIYTLGLTYLYENIPKRSRYPIYSGMMYALAGLGPVLGFGMASYFLNIYVLPWSIPESVDGPTHPQFVGAWWIGLLVCTAITFSAAIPLFFFPDRYGARAESKSDASAHDQIKQTLASGDANGHADGDEAGERLQESDNDEFREPEEPVNMDFGQSCANIPHSLKLIFQARVWVGVTIVLIAENSVVVWFATYFPKYLETTFHVQRSSASIMTGLILIPAACSGVISGGLIAKKLKRTVAIIKYLFCVTVINMLLQFSSIFIRCDQLQFAGVTSTHDMSAMRILPQSRVDKLTTMNQTLRDRCNANCDCSFNEYAPVCASVDGRALTFYNPCFAGCTSYTYHNWTEGDIVKSTYAYYNCSCAASPPPVDNYTDPLLAPAYNATWLANSIITLSNGVCSVDCNMLIPFIVVIFVVVFVVTSGQNPTLILTLQSVGDEHRSFALAVQTFFIRTLAYLPAPIYFGQLFDAQCILTQPDSCESNEDSLSIGYYSSGYCILYDSAMLAYTMLGCTLMLKTIVLLAVIFCWVSAKQAQNRKSRTPEKPRILEISDVTNVDNYDEQQDTACAMQHGNVTPSHKLNHSESKF